MYFLSFETSTKIFSLALSYDDKVLRFRNIKTAKILENSILPAVDKILDAQGIAFHQLGGFAIALGPGSFTSLRVGLATVKAFAMATNKPVVGIATMDIIAQGLDFKHCDEICVVLDARRGKVYSALYSPKGRSSEFMLSTLEDVLEKVHGRTLFVGDAVGLYRTEIEKTYKKYAKEKKSSCKCLFAEEKFWYPQAKVMAVIAHQRFVRKEHDSAAQLLPLYLYAQDCQVQGKS